MFAQILLNNRQIRFGVLDGGNNFSIQFFDIVGGRYTILPVEKPGHTIIFSHGVLTASKFNQTVNNTGIGVFVIRINRDGMSAYSDDPLIILLLFKEFNGTMQRIKKHGMVFCAEGCRPFFVLKFWQIVSLVYCDGVQLGRKVFVLRGIRFKSFIIQIFIFHKIDHERHFGIPLIGAPDIYNYPSTVHKV